MILKRNMNKKEYKKFLEHNKKIIEESKKEFNQAYTNIIKINEKLRRIL
jgi:hypothetical protein